MFIKIREKLYNLSKADGIATTTNEEERSHTIWFIRNRVAYDWIQYKEDEVAEFIETYNRIIERVTK